MVCDYVIGAPVVCACVCVLPSWVMLDRSVMILLAFLLLEGACAGRDMAKGQNREIMT